MIKTEYIARDGQRFDTIAKAETHEMALDLLALCERKVWQNGRDMDPGEEVRIPDATTVKKNAAAIAELAARLALRES